MKFSKILINPLVLVLTLYIGVLVVINPFGNYVVNDEWAHTMQVEGFLHRSFRIQANTDAVLILQAWGGFIAASIFGFSLGLMKLLVFGCSLLLVCGLYSIGVLLKLSRFALYCLLFLIVFNPLFLHLSSVFMTDIPFLTLFVWAVYWYLRFFVVGRPQYALVGSFFGGLAVLVRQAGLIPFIAFLLLTTKKKNTKWFYVACVIYIAFVAVYLLYPRYSADGHGGVPILSNVISLKELPNRAFLLLSSLGYFGFFTFPLAFMVKKSNVSKWLVILATLLCAVIIYIVDIFPMGNILYLEGLYAKNYATLYISLFNNVLVKLLLSLIIGYSIVCLGRFLCSFKDKRDKVTSFLVLLFLGSVGVLFFGNDLYDRYLLPAFLILLILLTKELGDVSGKAKKIILVATLTYFVISVFLVNDYTQVTKVRWQAAAKITEVTNVKTQIYLDGSFAKYNSTRKIKDYTGLTYIETSQSYLCYTEIFRNGISDESNALINKKQRLSFEPKAQDQIIFEQQIFSPQYNLLGVSSKVVGWCKKNK